MRTVKSGRDDRHKNLKELSDGSVDLDVGEDDVDEDDVDGLMDEIDVIDD